jgi:hypothetical protein
MIDGELRITTSLQYQLDLGDTELKTTLDHLGEDIFFKVSFDDTNPPAQAGAK